MTFTVSTFDIASEYIGADEAIPAGAFDFTFDDEGCLKSYWVTVNKATGSKELIYTIKGEAALNAYMENTEFDVTTSNGANATGLLATDYAISDYNTWK